MSPNNKYNLFKNLMYNELGITKEDIKEWTKEAVHEVAEDYLKHQFSIISLDRRINSLIDEETIRRYGHSLKDTVARELASQLEISLKNINEYKSTPCFHQHTTKDEDVVKCISCGAIVWQKINT